MKRLDAGAGSICQRQVLQPRSDVCCCAFQRERRRGACNGSAVVLRRLELEGVARRHQLRQRHPKELRSRAVGCSVIERSSSAGLVVTIVIVTFVG